MRWQPLPLPSPWAAAPPPWSAVPSPSAVATIEFKAGGEFSRKLSVGLSVLLILTYGLGMLFSLKTHREHFASAGHGRS